MNKIKYLLLCTLCFLHCINISAYDFEVNGICYTITSFEKFEVEVANNMKDDNHYPVYKGHIVIPQTVIFKEKEFKVTSIGEKAFVFCSDLISIDLGNVREIKEYAFQDCKGLSTINFKNVEIIGRHSFGNCYGLTSIDFGNVKSIKDGAFNDCSNLTSIDFKNIQSIEGGAFENCLKLTTILLRNITRLDYAVFYNCKNLALIQTDEKTPLKIEDNTFSRESYINATLQVPKSSKSNYQAAEYWKYFLSITEK